MTDVKPKAKLITHSDQENCILWKPR